MATAGAITPNPGYTPVAKQILQYPLSVDKFITVVPTDYAQDYWFENSNTQILDETGQASEEGEVQRIYMDKNKKYYTVDDRAFETIIPRRTQIAGQQQRTDEVQEAVVALSMLTRTRHEVRGSSFMKDDANYRSTGSDKLLLVGATDFTKWASASTGHPIDDIYTLLTRLGPFDPALSKLTIGFGIDAANRIATHDDVLEAIKYVRGGGRAGPDDLKLLFSKWYPVDEVVFLQPVLQGATGSAAKIWTADEVYVSVTQRDKPDKIKPTGAACFRQKVEGEEDVCVYVDDVREGAHGGKAVKVAVSETFKLIDNQWLGRLKDAV